MITLVERGDDLATASIGNGQVDQLGCDDVMHTLDTMHDAQAVMVDLDDRPSTIVRRLTPREAERLQGFPDDWSRYGISEKGDVYEVSDSARYRLQGNSIARPFWTWLLRRIAAQYERPATLGSLFDGQAGFPLCWQEVGGVPIWASEIDKHAVAVAKYHFPDGD